MDPLAPTALLSATPCAAHGSACAVMCWGTPVSNRRMMCASTVTFADADGATPFNEVLQLLQAADAGHEIAIGSRRANSGDATRERAGLRALMGQMFYSFVNFLAVPGINDTQCGFKLFTRAAARQVFERARLDRFCFDVELLAIAETVVPRGSGDEATRQSLLRALRTRLKV